MLSRTWQRIYWLVCFIIVITHSYYLNENSLTWLDAQTFCRSHCKSALASFHSPEDYLAALLIIQNSTFNYLPPAQKSVWFGFVYIPNFWYIDTTPFDFGNNITQSGVTGVWPWTVNEPTKTFANCGQLSYDANYLWDDTQCSDRKRSLCNECKWNILTKYIAINEETLPNNHSTFSQAQSYCQQQFNTDLASIHSEDDYNMIKTLCEVSYDTVYCGFGLTDVLSEGTFRYLDNTTFDYGSNVSGGVYPWTNPGNGDKNPDNGAGVYAEEDCVELPDYSQWGWNDVGCDYTRSQETFVCNLPSELCFRNKWNIVSGSWLWNGCDLLNNNTALDRDSVIVLDVTDNGWNRVSAQHIFAVKEFVMRGFTAVGFNIYDYENQENHMIYIGMQMYDNKTSIELWCDAHITLNESVIGMYGLGIFYVLRIELNEYGMINATLNDNSFLIHFNLESYYPQFKLPDRYFINGIQIRNRAFSTHSKSFFINGDYNPYPPTAAPTEQPTLSPTEGHDFSALAEWSKTFLSIFVDIVYEPAEVEIDATSLQDDCGAVLDADTMDIIGGNDANCFWSLGSNLEYDLRIDLPSTAIINLVNNTLVLLPGAFRYSWSATGTGSNWHSNGELHVTVSTPNVSDIAKPTIITNVLSTIGRCDDLVLDARSSTGLGGRDNAVYTWTIYDIQQQYDGALVTVANTNISALTNEILIGVTVRNWFGGVSQANVTTFKSLAGIVPIIDLNGINEYSSTDKLLNGKIDIYSYIIFKDSCDSGEVILNENSYDITWFVTLRKQNENEVIDAEKLQTLHSYLASQANYDSLSIEVSDYLQSGLFYTFIMNFKCEGSTYDCDVNATHVVHIQYTPISCQIMGGDIQLNNIAIDDLEAYTMVLNGGLFTFDPDTALSNHLGFTWQCVDDIHDVGCNELLDSTETAVVNAHFENITTDNNYNGTQYEFSFTLQVYDKNNEFRDACFDVVKLNANVLLANETDFGFVFLVISSTALSNRINVDDKLRIIADIVNFNHDYNDLVWITTHKWYEVNGLLSDEDMITYSHSSDNSLNLVLAANILTAGLTYSLQLTVLQYDADSQLIARGNSSIISIYVLSGPKIIYNSFTIAPNCENGIIFYDSINDYVETDTFSLSVLADGDNVPLLYQFSNNGQYLHPHLLATSYVNDIYLQIGNNALVATVYDSRSAFASDSIVCDVQLNSYTQCIDDSLLFINIDSFLTDYERYWYVLQTSYVSLQYLYDFRDGIQNTNHCLQQILGIILMTLNTNINEICGNNMNFVVLLSQVLKLWMDSVHFSNNLMSNFYKNKYNKAMIENLISTTLDPCLYIVDEIGYDNIEELSISTESIITNVVKIYYKNEDITHYLSKLEIDDNYKHLLYLLAEPLIELISYSNNIGIYNLLSSALYIASLSTISTSIPGEEILIKWDKFSLFSTKISNNNNISVTVQNISVFIPQINNKGNKLNPLDLTNSLNVLMVGIDTNESVVNISQSSNECEEEGTLSSESISITILGNNTNTNNLSSNIVFEFNCNPLDGCNINDGYECMYLNVTADIWQNNGCITIINQTINKIHCECAHLTTFATIHNIYAADDCNHNTFMHQLFEWEYWDYINAFFGLCFLLIAIYIFLEIYPFFVDKYLKYKQLSVYVMLTLFAVSIIYFMICVTFYFLKSSPDPRNNTVTINILTLLLLAALNIYFISYSIIFFTWFVLTHSMSSSTFENMNDRIKIILFVVNILMAMFTIIVFILIVSNWLHINEYILVIEMLWSCICLIICFVFIIYAACLAKVLFKNMVKTSKAQSFGGEDLSTARKLLFINFCITLFFLIQFVSSIYFTLYWDEFNIVYRIIDLSLNLLFIILLCWMYRKPMRRLIKYDAKKRYNYYCCCNKCFILNRSAEIFTPQSQTTVHSVDTATNINRDTKEQPIDSKSETSDNNNIEMVAHSAVQEDISNIPDFANNETKQTFCFQCNQTPLDDNGNVDQKSLDDNGNWYCHTCCDSLPNNAT